MNDVEAKFPQFTVLITAFLQTLIIQPIKDSFYYMWSVSIIVPVPFAIRVLNTVTTAFHFYK